ncbi:radical SAM protein [Bradyrhizobium elkanii]|uniref:radical SAM protein n=1 Tax=Bradyrhizobium elkanii TaxID=29448 RepID=UPI002714563A|nr:radical SAM protein [Bradyrhizobium elkanii]WLA50430.1 radical SAM protein [Bradyrhizobium elkanii]WLB79335.1 radical SAM protein [Bradyrhizobium elkanii]
MSVDASNSVAFQEQPITQLLVKVAARCNIDCSYCYWFRDAAVYDKPKLMSAEVLQQLLLRLEQHVARYSLVDFPVILHGGEPLLWGVDNFHRFAEACQGVSSRTGCEIPIAVTTNGVLIDDEWLDCFEARNISVAISIDGPAHIHDAHRKTFQGTGTHAAVERAARMLVSRDIGVIALAVCNPAYAPQEYADFFAACGISNYDIMIPDATVDEKPSSIAPFYNGLFDLWLEANRTTPTSNVRIISDMVAALIGNNAPTEGVGHKPVELCTVMTDGTVEAHDVLRIAGDGFTNTRFNIFDHAIDDVRTEPRWKAARDASVNLCEKCRQCKFMNACGGGYLPHRFSRKNGFDNPSVYCDDLYSMFENMQSVLERHLYVRKQDGERIGVRNAAAGG